MNDDAKELRPTADVSARRIARVYAEALLNAAHKAGQADAILDEFASLLDDVFGANPRLESVLSAAAMGRRAREAAFRSAFQGRASDTFFNFLLVLNDHERLDLLRTIFGVAREIHDERQRRVRVQVQSAVPLHDDQRDRLQRDLREAFRLEPVLESRIDPELLGGLRVRVGDWLYDASVRTQLETLRHQLIARSSHEIQSRRDRFSSAERD
jgi:F-type H+-transporting ATPase subunit delta